MNQRTIPEAKWVTIVEAAQILAVHPNTIRNLINKNVLKAYRLGSRIIRIDANELETILITGEK
jgi:excisionase family DNA binding protein